MVDGTVFVTWLCPGSSRSWAVQALHADTGHPRWPEPLRLLPPQHWLVSGDRVLAIAHEPGTGAPCLATYDVHGGTLLWQRPLSDLVVGSPTTSVNSIHLAHPDGHVSSWDALTGDNPLDGQGRAISPYPARGGGRTRADHVLGSRPAHRPGRR
ncbi:MULTISPECIES: PQQ-binding-like beta-propeller repeat protein [unclassified Streptomyces]|uniref:PQQ-binding-like beta-propeller repeat protein n=1 Tax=unclassified Streptomyces TaxID=2593676 RepID=UPI0036EAA637